MVNVLADEDIVLGWIEAARAGDSTKLGLLLESCRGYLLMVAGRGISRDLRAKGGASDFVQETLFGAHRDFGTFHGRTRDELLAWLQQILRNNLAGFRRRYRGTEKRSVAREVSIDSRSSLRGCASLPDASATPFTRAERGEQIDKLLSALGQLDETYRQVIIWHQYDQLSHEEIGRRLGRSAEAARKLWSRALIRLTEQLDVPSDTRDRRSPAVSPR